MADCAFVITPLPNGKYLHKCSRDTCPNEFILPTNKPVNMNCKAVHLLRRVFNFSLASIQHALQKLPTCTQEEIDERQTICKGCPLYAKKSEYIGYCSHESCGCSITNYNGYLNKLAWRDQVCPIGSWPELGAKDVMELRGNNSAGQDERPAAEDTGKSEGSGI